MGFVFLSLKPCCYSLLTRTLSGPTVYYRPEDLVGLFRDQTYAALKLKLVLLWPVKGSPGWLV